MNLIEYLRKESINHLFQLNSFENNWNTMWKDEVLTKIKVNNLYNHNNILNLGDSLAEIFGTSNTGRTQSGVSAAGTTWEALVCWYLNLCLINTRVVVLKQKKGNIPSPITDALTVMYGNSPSNTEADLIAIVFPDRLEYTQDISNLNTYDIFQGITLFNNRGLFQYLNALNMLVERDSNDIDINVIQCKTNWNDNAQIPMLWDMVYRAQGFQTNNISVGRNGYSLDSFNNFFYSFVTVPTVNIHKINHNSVCVKRVATLSGGNYWGHPSQNNVANSVKEITRNFSRGITPNIRTTLSDSIDQIDSTFSYFKL